MLSSSLARTDLFLNPVSVALLSSMHLWVTLHGMRGVPSGYRFGTSNIDQQFKTNTSGNSVDVLRLVERMVRPLGTEACKPTKIWYRASKMLDHGISSAFIYDSRNDFRGIRLVVPTICLLRYVQFLTTMPRSAAG